MEESGPTVYRRTIYQHRLILLGMGELVYLVQKLCPKLVLALIGSEN